MPQPGSLFPLAHDRRPSSDSLSRLALFCLSYVLLATLVTTLAPFRFAWPKHFAPNFELGAFDVILNLLLMVPLGFLLPLAWPRARRDRHGLLVLALGLGLSSALELVQLFLPDRCASPLDVIANGAGAWAGAWLNRRAGDWFEQSVLEQLRSRPSWASLPYLALPLLWLDGLGANEAPHVLLSLPLGLAGVWVAAAAWPRADAPGSRYERVRVGRLVAAWFGLGLLPALCTAPGYAMLSALGVGIATACLLREPGTSVGAAGSAAAPVWRRDREALDARLRLRLCAPLVLAYLVGAAIWPCDFRAGFRFSAGFPWVVGSSCEEMLAFLEYAFAFTLLGYLLAELDRRSRAPRGRARVVAVLGLLAFALELVRGFSTTHAASFVTFGCVLAAGSWGGAFEHALQGARQKLRGAGARPLSIPPFSSA